MTNEQQQEVQSWCHNRVLEMITRARDEGIEYPQNYNFDFQLNRMLLAIEHQMGEGQTFEEALEWAKW